MNQELERLFDIQELDRMLDVVSNQKKDEIASGKEYAVDIIKHDSLTFKVKQNDQDIEVTQTVYEVLFEKDGELFHEFYNDQGKLLCPPISDKEYQEGKKIEELGLGNFEENSLMSTVYKDQSSKSLSELENEQIKEVSKALEMKPEDVKDLNIVQFNSQASIDEQTKKAQEELKKYSALGMEIDTNELATSDDTIKEFLNIDADKLLAIQINGDWKLFDISDGSLKLEKNLEISSSEKSFSTVEADGIHGTRLPEIEFRRKDNPDYSLAIDSNNSENKTQAFLIVGESRTATEIESASVKVPYSDYKNNELMKQAQENPDEELIVSIHSKKEKANDEEKDPHEPDERQLVDPTFFPNNY